MSGIHENYGEDGLCRAKSSKKSVFGEFSRLFFERDRDERERDDTKSFGRVISRE